MKSNILFFSAALFLFPFAAGGQSWNIKTNLIYDATTTLNLGVEFRTGGKTSLDLSGNLNPWTFGDNRKWKHYLIQPELRWWPKGVFKRHFWGLHGHYALYNVSNLPHGPFTHFMRDNRFEGWLAGAGISWGYRWNFRHRWALEATVGVGYTYLSFDRFECGDCGKFVESETNYWVGPTKVGLNLIFGGGGRRAPQPVPVVVPQPEPEIVPYEPNILASFVTREQMPPEVLSQSERALFDFALNDWRIVPGYRGNAAALNRIDRMMSEVMDDPDARLTAVAITGYSSPDGSWAVNETLSERRAQALKDYIAGAHDLPEHLFEVHGAGEDWAGLDSLVSRSDMYNKERILEIIRGTGVFAGREAELMALSGGAPYRRMKAEMFPQLRHVVCRVEYEVTDSDDLAAVNAAAEALARRDIATATIELEKVGNRNAPWWNNMGVLSWQLGDKAKAAECFDKAGAFGAANAAELRKHLSSLEK
jgi:outer membrane protein OmpA-like peptidoglycan-associated protein